MSQNSITILAIESSCDETAASVIVDGKILSNFIANQAVHEKYGGVVPELASRAHMENIVPVVEESLKKAFPNLSHNHRLSQLDAICHRTLETAGISSIYLKELLEFLAPVTS